MDAREVFARMLLLGTTGATWGEELTDARSWLQRGGRREKQETRNETKRACVRASKLKREALWGPRPAVPDRSHGLGAARRQCGPCPTGGEAAGGRCGETGPPVRDQRLRGADRHTGSTCLSRRPVRLGHGRAGSMVRTDECSSCRCASCLDLFTVAN